MNTTIRRRPWLAALLSLFSCGLGQLYNGQARKAVFFYFFGFLLAALLSQLGLFFSFQGLVFGLCLVFCYGLCVPVEAFVAARRARTIDRKWYNRWFVYVLVILIEAFAIGPLLKPICFPSMASYKISSASMMPTFMMGDHLIALKQTETNRMLNRGDVAIFEAPQETKADFVKRVIGLPGETIEMKEGIVFINGQPIQEFYLTGPETQVTLVNDPAMNSFGPLLIPNDSFFVLGDNRAASLDSRHFGPVSLTSLKGKALYIYWSKDRKRIGKKVK